MENLESDDVAVEPNIPLRDLDIITGTVSGQYPRTHAADVIKSIVLNHHKAELQTVLVAVARVRIRSACALTSEIERAREELFRKVDLKLLQPPALVEYIDCLVSWREKDLKYTTDLTTVGISERGTGINIGNMNIDSRQINVNEGNKTPGEEVAALDKTSRDRVRDLLDKLLENRKLNAPSGT